MKVFIGICLTLALALPAMAKNKPCYGKAEIQLAQELLRTVPYLGLALDHQKRVAMRVRNETCLAVAQARDARDIDYAYEFFGDVRNRSIAVAAQRRDLDPLKVQAALVDLYWPPKIV
jgi:hypothetical protein